MQCIAVRWLIPFMHGHTSVFLCLVTQKKVTTLSFLSVSLLPVSFSSFHISSFLFCFFFFLLAFLCASPPLSLSSFQIQQTSIHPAKEGPLRSLPQVPLVFFSVQDVAKETSTAFPCPATALTTDKKKSPAVLKSKALNRELRPTI